MRSIVAFTCAVAALVAVPSVSAGKLLDNAATPRLPVSLPTAMDCDTCELVVGIVQAIAENATTIETLITTLDQDCAVIFANDSSNAHLCEVLANATVNLLPFLDKQMRTLAWDIPAAFCSVIVPACHFPCCETPYIPEQLHLSLQGNDMSIMGVSWVTYNESSNPTVQYSIAGEGAWMTENAAARTYTEGGWLGTIYTAVMQDLQPATTYTYRVGDISLNIWSDEYNFTTFPLNIGTAARPLTMIQVGDMAYDNHSDATVATMIEYVESGAVDMILHIGDISYADGYMIHWDMFMNKIQPAAARVPYMTVAGNHELWFNFTAYKTRFFMPMEDQYQSMYYSFNVGPIHFLMMNTETAIDTADLDDQQLGWIKQDLAAVNRSTTKWIVGTGHRPFYCSNNDNTQCGLFAGILRMQGEDLLMSNGVDLVITAHEHGMEQTFPVYNNNATSHSYASPTAPVYIVNGAAGNREGNDNPAGNPNWTAWHSGDVGFAFVQISSSNNMGQSAIEWQFRAANNTMLQSFTLSK